MLWGLLDADGFGGFGDNFRGCWTALVPGGDLQHPWVPPYTCGCPPTPVGAPDWRVGVTSGDTGDLGTHLEALGTRGNFRGCWTPSVPGGDPQHPWVLPYTCGCSPSPVGAPTPKGGLGVTSAQGFWGVWGHCWCLWGQLATLGAPGHPQHPWVTPSAWGCPLPKSEQGLGTPLGMPLAPLGAPQLPLGSPKILSVPVPGVPDPSVPSGCPHVPARCSLVSPCPPPRLPALWPRVLR